MSLRAVLRLGLAFVLAGASPGVRAGVAVNRRRARGQVDHAETH
ncbi:MAG: hypothetical protein DVB23_002034 [Verrucomicrobia bacterium]|jgi:hypothetical protein|nr:MAG: hypothetical protein DVB23_002034 [Verrucomicrobiota bacterium]